MTNSSSLELLNCLEKLGLTSSEGRAYLAVARLGLCKVNQIARVAGLQRTEIYRLMDNLVSKGLVKETIDKPRRYLPVSFKLGIQRLIEQDKQQLRTAVEDSGALVQKLKSMESVSSWDANNPTIAILTGKDEITKHFEECLANARDEIRISAGSLNAFATSQMIKSVADATTKKKLRTRTIVDINKGVPRSIAKLNPIVNIRHFEPIHAQFYCVDDKCAALGLGQEKNPNEVSQLVVSYRPLVRTMSQFFDAVWGQAIPFTIFGLTLERPFEHLTQVLWGKDEIYALMDRWLLKAMRRIAGVLTARGPDRVIARVEEGLREALRRGVRVQLLCNLSRASRNALSQLSSIAEIRTYGTTLGFGLYLLDDAEAVIHYRNPDSPSIEEMSLDIAIRVKEMRSVRGLSNMFDYFWKQSTPFRS